ncbi:putative membrane protein [Stackebrandtia albiflava]|uniref:Putative membrane protein n=1 Tax=Stackebrandtia albiflava TaxID=406432 RepID=A0A562UY28_9ACTN|nr:cytochrome c oxidase assembly protein [Stackebrandtia albiflava]TWJ10493.1 putative membrane protein [Stackebrandtia albiflava]
MTWSAHHPHPGHGTPFPVVEAGVAVFAVTAVILYLVAAARLRRRGDAWNHARDVAFTAGGVLLAVSVWTTPPGGPFTVHMVRHLAVAMVAPVLLVLARPVTLTLRSLPPGRHRRALLRTTRSRPASWLLFPPVAALWNLGGLWLLYRTPLAAATGQDSPWHGAVMLHLLAAGLLFGFAVCQVDPTRHRHGLLLRGGTLFVAGAAHAILAKSLYATPPPGTSFDPVDLHTGAQWMYYGGDVVEVAIAVVLAAQWYTARERDRARRLRRDAVVRGTVTGD